MIKTNYVNQVRYTTKETEERGPWHDTCAGHTTMILAIGCKERQWMGSQEYYRKHADCREDFDAHICEVRIIKRTLTEEVVEAAEQFVPAK